MTELWQFVLIGLVIGSLYALIALGYTMVYGIIELINFAHGDLFMLGSFFALSLAAGGSWRRGRHRCAARSSGASSSCSRAPLRAGAQHAGRLIGRIQPLRNAPSWPRSSRPSASRFIFMNMRPLLERADVERRSSPISSSNTNLLESAGLRVHLEGPDGIGVTVPSWSC